MSRPSITLVEAHEGLRRDLERALIGSGFRVSSHREANASVRRSQARNELCVLDLTAPGVSDALAQCASLDRTVLIASDSPRDLRDWSDPRVRALEVLVKPFDYCDLESAIVKVERAAEFRARSAEDPLLESADPRVIHELERARRLARRDVSISLEGELGTGRRALAEAIHQWSSRAMRPLVVLERAMLEDADVEARFAAAIDRAAGGTVVVVDPVELSRVRQRGVVSALRKTPRATESGRGSASAARWLCVTSVGLEQAVGEGRLEPELYYRLEDARIALPALRDREADHASICRGLAARLARELRQPVPEVDAALVSGWAREGFPGNRLGLEARLRHALLRGDPVATDGGRILTREEGVRGAEVPPAAASVHLKTLERDAIIRALAGRSGNRTHAAGDLGINVRTLRNKIREYGLR